MTEYARNVGYSQHVSSGTRNGNTATGDNGHHSGGLNGNGSGGTGRIDLGETTYELSERHWAMLTQGSGIAPEPIIERPWFLIDNPLALVALGYQLWQYSGPGLAFAFHAPGSDLSEPTGFGYRPDQSVSGRKYIWAYGVPNNLDVPRRFHGILNDPTVELGVVEGAKKGDALAGYGIPAVVLAGVDNWRGTNAKGGKTVLAAWEHIALNDRVVVIYFDSDAQRNPHVKRARRRLTDWLRSKKVKVKWSILPDLPNGEKCGVDDYLLTHSVEELRATIIDAPDADRPRLPARKARIDELVDDAWDAVTANGIVYRRSGKLFALDFKEDGRLGTTPVNADGLLYYLSEGVDFYVRKQTPGVTVEESVRPEKQLAAIMASHIGAVQELKQMVNVPVFLPGGRLLTRPGYDPDTGIYYDPAGATPVIPAEPTPADVRAARELLLQLIGGFPLADAASRAQALALALQPFVRPLIDGPTPAYLVESPTQGSGKGLLVRVLTRAALRARPSIQPPPTSEEEWRKSITTAVLEQRNIYFVDNLKDEITSAALAGALTTDTYSDRLLGSNQSIDGAIRWPWVLAANNPTVDTDIARRCVRIRLVPASEEPWLIPQESFAIPRIEAWAIEHEAELTAALLTLVQAWVQVGMPKAETLLGSFEAWSEVLGGILQTAGIPGFLDNLREFYDAANAERTGWREFVRAWWDKHRDKAVTVAELYQLVHDGSGLFELGLGGRDDDGKRKSLGRKLGRQRDRLYGSWQIVKTQNPHTKIGMWQLKAIEVMPGASDDE